MSARRHTLLTGATGQVGRHLLVELLRRGESVAVLIRGSSDATAKDRVRSLLAGTELPTPVVLEGDLNSRALGLTNGQRAWVAENVVRVLHSAANLSFRPASESPDNEPFRTNVDGLRTLIGVVDESAIADFHYVSTAYVCGLSGGPVAEGPPEAAEFANDYECSKAKAESILRAWADGDPARTLTVTRPSIVIDSTDRSRRADRTVYNALNLYATLGGRFGLGEPGQWLSTVGLSGDERKNIIESAWAARVIAGIAATPSLHGRTYHVTAPAGTRVEDLDRAFTAAVTDAGLAKPGGGEAIGTPLFEAMAGSFVGTFLPYFRNDPRFERRNLEHALETLGIADAEDVSFESMRALSAAQLSDDSWSAGAKTTGPKTRPHGTPGVTDAAPAPEDSRGGVKTASQSQPATTVAPGVDDLVIVGMDVCVPGADGVEAFEDLLFADDPAGRVGYGHVPEDRLDRGLYVDPEKGKPGRTYTTLGGVVPERPVDRAVAPITDEDEANHDPTHLRFCEVAARAWRSAGLKPNDAAWARTGVYVGHSGGTKHGGPLALASLIEEAAELVDDLLVDVSDADREAVKADFKARVRATRPQRTTAGPRYDAYEAASLTARTLGLAGPRQVVDAACASSLVALAQAKRAIGAGRIDAALVGGATYNGSDNLILFSQSQACGTEASRPFDDRADGLVSSEGYAAVVLTTRGRADAAGLPILAELTGVGVASDGRGKSLWAPRTEGQQLALRRAYPDGQTLAVDTLECHATSTSLGDATELETIAAVYEGEGRLPIGSAKSNLGHTLEAAGLIGLVKQIVSMRRGERAASAGFSEPSARADWNATPARVLSRPEPWPATDGVRTGGVSAFGIGGLNAHAVVRQSASPAPAADAAGSPQKDSPIAIVGRGVVLAGADSTDRFRDLLDAGGTSLQPAPSDRWRNAAGVSGGEPTAFAAPHNVGGYITDWSLDGMHYRIPPKQVAQASPTQMMLLDAVAQAAREAGLPGEIGRPGVAWPGREGVGVTIGTVFGGEFSNQLQLGLRLPELTGHFRDALTARGLDASSADGLTDHLLRHRPALLDETGSFTASTLASRVAKTFDVMGGAAAVDAGDASAMAALFDAADRLRAGECHTMIVGTAQRALDLPAFERLDLAGRLQRSGNPSEIPDDCRTLLPGEGVGVLILRRLEDAVADGQTVLGVLDDFAAKPPGQPQAAMDAEDARIVRATGYLCGSHALLRAITGRSKTLAATAEDGVTLSCSMQPADSWSAGADADGRPDHSHGTPGVFDAATAAGDSRGGVKTAGKSRPAMTAAPRVDHSRFPATPAQTRMTAPVIRIEAATESEFAAQLEAAAANPPRGVAAFGESSRFRAAARDEAGFAALAKAFREGRRAVVAERHHAVLLERTDADRVAWLFPGQGSQYRGTPAAAEMPAGRLAIEALNAALAAEGQDAFGFESSTADVYATQVWTLAASEAARGMLADAGHRCDVVLGHSFGECGAAVAAGAITLRQAARLSRLRADAVAMAGGHGGLLSVRATPSEVAATAAATGLTLSHHNAPRQAVLSGRAESIAEAKRLLGDAGFAAADVPVATAFHSSMLADAETTLRRQFTAERLRPPGCGYLSAVSLRFLAEPDDVRESLISQLTRPVQFAAAVRRLVEAGVAVAAEVGPGRVLSKLAAESGLPLLCVPTDSAEGLPLYELALECVRGGAVAEPARRLIPKPSANGHSTKSVNRVAVFDVRGDDVIRPSGRREDEPDADHSVAPREAAPAVTSEQTLGFLTDLVVELTGYDRAVVDADADLEADLGVDSIKKAQIIGELAEWSGLATAPENLRLDDVRTLGQIAELAVARPKGRSEIEFQPDADHSVGVGDTPTADTLDRLMTDFVVDQTGYDRSVIDADADLEADLGVDSIKQAQLLGEMHAQFGLAVDLDGGRSLSEFRTLRSIREYLLERLDADSRSAGADAVGQQAESRGTPGVIDAATTSDDSRGGVEVVDQSRPGRTAAPGVTDAASASEDSRGGVKNSSQSRPTQTAAPGVGRSETPTLRFALRTTPAPHRPNMPSRPTLAGPALIVGAGPLADALVEVVKECGQTASVIDAADLPAAEGAFERVWADGPAPHLFLTTPASEVAMRSLDAGRWSERRTPAIEVPYRLCQLWNERTIEAGLMDRATVVACTSLGGAYGFDGDVDSPEGGGVGALVKAMLIEGWMRGFRTTPMKVVDVAPGTDPDEAADAVFRELAVPSYDMELATDGRDRTAVQAVTATLAEDAKPQVKITRGGAWVVSGGGRGITPLCAMSLAERHDLVLHLLGTAPVPDVAAETREAYGADRSALRRRVMADANAAGENGIEAWRDLEKSVEIDATLSEAARRGVRATYHQCNVADATAVATVLDTVRKADGPIRGVIHGAGAGQDARFDRKRPDKVDKCIRAKVDGCVALAEATQDDPLEWFVGFGSISGRFGANGHTDYSLANDMLAKCVTRLRKDRPGLAAVTFHWHAWGDVGMATKPEARLTLEMIDMEFMPAADGVAHFLRELEHGGDEAEVLITDRNYYRKFFPADRVSDDTLAGQLPLLGVEPDGECESAVTLDPKRDRFLAQHTVRGVPTLPMAVAVELMCEAARRKTEDAKAVVALQEVEALAPLKFQTEDPQAVTVTASGGGPVVCSLTADVRRRDGRLVEESREFFRGEVLLREQPTPERADAPGAADLPWRDVEYLPKTVDGQPATVFHGPPLRQLRRVAHTEDAKGNPVLFGEIAGPAAIELFDERRPGRGWSTTAAVTDACLYAAALHVIAQTGRPNLPVSFGRLTVGRTPDPGEPCRVRVRTTKSGKRTARLDWTLTGLNGDVLMRAESYKVAFLDAPPKKADRGPASPTPDRATSRADEAPIHEPTPQHNPVDDALAAALSWANGEIRS